MLSLAGCGSGSSTSEEASNPVDSSINSADPWAVPDPIDVAYVQRVVNEIEEQRDLLLDEVYATQQFSKLTESRLRAIYAQPYLDLALQAASEGSMTEHPELKADTAPAIVPVKSIRSARADCISAVVDVDDGPSLKEPGIVGEFVVTLRHTTSVASSNVTRWQESNWDATSAQNGKVDRCAES